MKILSLLMYHKQLDTSIPFSLRGRRQRNEDIVLTYESWKFEYLSFYKERARLEK